MMTIQPISSATTVSPVMRLPDELILKIFKLFIDLLIKDEKDPCAIMHLRICREWQHFIESSRVDQCVFQHLRWEFSQTTSNWLALYHLRTGACFMHPPSKRIVSYSNELDVEIKHEDLEAEKYHHLLWIDRGFIFYKQNEDKFNICMFNSPDTLLTINCARMIRSILVIQDLIICGMENGQIVGYSLENSTWIFETAFHTKPVQYLFTYRDGWISVCSQQIVQWDGDRKPTPLLSNLLSHTNNEVTTLKQCFLEQTHLFLEFEASPNSLGERFVYYSFSLIPLGTTLEGISPPPEDRGTFDDTNIFTHVWVNEMATIQDDETIIPLESNRKSVVIKRFPFHHQAFFSMKPSSPVKRCFWIYEKLSPYPDRCCFFRGNVVLIIDTFTIPPFEKIQKLNIINIRDGGVLTTEITPPIDDISLCNNRLYGISPESHEVVIFEFPLPKDS